MAILNIGKMSRSDAGKLGAAASRGISNEARRQRILKYNAYPKTCRQCGKAIPYDKRANDFCSHFCAAIFNNALRGKTYVPKQKKNCTFCGKETTNEKWCSHACQIRFAHREYIRRWKAGIEPGGTPNNVSRHVKKYLVESRGHKCEICSLSMWLGKPAPLVVDHISGNALDHSENNLRLVCGNCNMQLPTFTGRNRHSGRKYRREAYHREKSRSQDSNLAGLGTGEGTP